MLSLHPSLRDEALKKSTKALEAQGSKVSTRMCWEAVEAAAGLQTVTRVLRKTMLKPIPVECVEEKVLKVMQQFPSSSSVREAQDLRLHSTRMLKLPVVLKELAETPPSKAREVGGGWETNPELKVMVP